jgi:hypothetical protein
VGTSVRRGSCGLAPDAAIEQDLAAGLEERLSERLLAGPGSGEHFGIGDGAAVGRDTLRFEFLHRRNGAGASPQYLDDDVGIVENPG